MINRNQIKELSDLELVNSYKETGDKAYVGELFERYTRFVFLVSMKYLKDEEESRDASMQIFEKLFIDLKKHQIQTFKSWHTLSNIQSPIG